MNTPEEPYSHYREILFQKKPSFSPFNIKKICDIRIYPYPDGVIYGSEYFPPIDRVNPVYAFRDYSGQIGIEHSYTDFGISGEKSLAMMVARGKGLMTFDVIEQGPAIRDEPINLDCYICVRPAFSFIGDSQNKGWNDKGELYISNLQGDNARVYIPSLEYGFFRSGEIDTYRRVVQLPLVQTESTRNIMVGNRIQITNVNSKGIEGNVIYPPSHFMVSRGEWVKDEADITMSYAKHRDTISVNIHDNILPLSMQIRLPEYRVNYWDELSRALSTNISERPHALHNLLTSWDTSIPILEPRY